MLTISPSTASRRSCVAAAWRSPAAPGAAGWRPRPSCWPRSRVCWSSGCFRPRSFTPTTRQCRFWTATATPRGNASERDLRPIAVGRSNWTFFGSDNGGRTAAVLYSLVATAKRHGLDPFVYLRDVLGRLSDHPMSRLEELLPDHWKLASAVPTPQPA